MKKTFLFSVALLSLFNTISAEEDTISALSATYEDSNLMLEGEVKLLHGLGTLLADKAFLYKQENDKNLPFSSIHLEDKVNILCKNEATLNCDIAKLDFIALKGEITALDSNTVTYAAKTQSSKEGVPFEIQSQTIDIAFDEQSKGAETEYLCNSILAKKKVLIQYANDFELKTDEAHYKRTAQDSSLTGVITAYPTTQDSICHLCYQGEDIETSSMEIIMEKSLIHLKDPKGSLPSSLFSSKQKGQLFFTCKDLNWDHAKGLLTLKQNIQIQESHFGCLSAEKILTIEQSKSKESAIINSLHADGPSFLSHNDSSLTSYGSLHVDGIKGQITILSPKTDGKVLPQDQILYQNNDMHLQADTSLLEYTEPLHELASLTFQGGIRIQSLENAATARCALADRLVYAPDTKTVILSAHSGKKVLFWDEEQGATLSAKEVHLTQNPQTGKTEIKGIGNMKLSLSPDEQKQLQKHFPKFPTSEETDASN